MKTLILATITTGLAAASGHGSNCTNPPLIWSLSFTYGISSATAPQPTAIYSDGNATAGSNPSYVNGVDGVVGVIQLCSGTNDATLDLSGSTRSIGWNFSQVLAANSYTPAWSGTSFYDKSFLNIRNVLYTPPGFNSTQSYTFTTRMGSQINSKATKTTAFHLRMENPTDQAVIAAPPDPTANSPYTDALVIVQHSPATATSPETWVAYPDPTSWPPQVGTLIEDLLRGTVNAGEYSMPFKFTITRM